MDEKQKQEEVIQVIRAALEGGVGLNADKVANVFREMIRQVQLLFDSTKDLNPQERWWRDVIEQTKIEPLSRAQALIEELLKYDCPSEQFRLKLAGVRQLLQQVAEKQQK